MTLSFNAACARQFLSVLLVSGCCLMSLDAFGHARWSASGSTPGRTNSDGNKVGPCGAARTNTPAVFKAGETVTLQWEATINHKGYFRIAFSPANDQGFDDNVLVDNILEREGSIGLYTARVTLPSQPCDSCTLQMIQVMLDRNPPTNYYSCADIKLVANMPADFEPPAPITNERIQGSAPAITLNWQNPTADFAGVMIARSIAGDPAPANGTSYSVADSIGSARVAYVGSAKQVAIDDANPGELFTLFAFDLANNYSTGVQLKAPAAELNVAPIVSVVAEQLGQSDGQFYTADGPIVLQATITDANPADTQQLNWQVPVGVDYQMNSPDQLNVDGGSTGAGRYSISVSATDSGQPPLSATANIDLTLVPYSRYQPRLVLMQNGREVTSVTASGGEVTVTVKFNGASPDDLSQWSTAWSHNIAGAVVEGLSLRFVPSDKASYSIEALVSSATALAAPKLTQSISTSKPIKIGAIQPLLGSLLLLLLGLNGCARLQRDH